MTQADSTSKAAETSSILIRSIRHVMRPVIRLMMRHGIVLQTFNELVKSVYTEEAEKEITAAGNVATDLQISLMTGIHRKEVKRFRDEGYDAFILSQTLCTGADVVTAWLTDRRFLSGRREPKHLTTRRGESVDSFSTLVRTVDAELRPNAVLAEMVRLGVVKVESDWAQLVVDAFVPQKGFDNKVQYLAENGHDFLATVVHNIGQPKTAMLEQSLSASAISAASAEDLERTARNLWKLVMQQDMERAIELEARDKAAGQIDRRINFGVYFYNESLPKSEGTASPERTRGRKSAKR
ncbi:MAG: DUF6502 family protein [Usitatibacteraceae bacterium]